MAAPQPSVPTWALKLATVPSGMARRVVGLPRGRSGEDDGGGRAPCDRGPPNAIECERICVSRSCCSYHREVTKPVVVLFDIDETLIHTGGSGARSWKAAFDKLYGVPADIGEHTSAGETDPQVARETFRGVLGRTRARTSWASSMPSICSTCRRHLDLRAVQGAARCRADPVAPREAGVMLGLVSGAMGAGGRTKLSPANLNRFFIFGAYGSDSPTGRS